MPGLIIDMKVIKKKSQEVILLILWLSACLRVVMKHLVLKYDYPYKLLLLSKSESLSSLIVLIHPMLYFMVTC